MTNKNMQMNSPPATIEFVNNKSNYEISINMIHNTSKKYITLPKIKNLEIRTFCCFSVELQMEFVLLILLFNDNK